MTEGLRARKRRTAMRQIQEAAFDLFDRDGFEAVPVERIAAAAEVSASSVYRYFGTKEGIVLHDPNSVAMTDLPAAPAELSVLEAFRQTVTGFVAEQGDRDDVVDRRRVRYLMEVPSVQAAVGRRLFSETSVLDDYVAGRLGRDRDDLEVQVSARALFGALLGALKYWHHNDYAEPLGTLLDRTFDTLRRGFDLDGAADRQS